MKPISIFSGLIAAGMLVSTTALSAPSSGSKQISYEVTVTNLTRGTSFTPILAATHRQAVDFLKLGQPASPELTAVAEAGDTGPLNSMILATPSADSASSGGLLDPGHSVTITVSTSRYARYLSLAAMLLPTNDGFIALNNVPLPNGRETLSYVSNGYDAGSETNDEYCTNIPGPLCGGEALSPADSGEGYVHIHAGIHGIGDLLAADYDWRNPVALITVRRVD